MLTLSILYPTFLLGSEGVTHPTQALSTWEIIAVIVSSIVGVVSFFLTFYRETRSDHRQQRRGERTSNQDYIKTTLEAMKQLTDDLRAEVERQKEEREEGERRALEKEQHLLAEIARLGLEVRALREQLNQKGVSLPALDATLMATIYPHLVLGVNEDDSIYPDSRP